MTREPGTFDTKLVDARGVADMLGLAHRNAVSTYQKRYADMPRPEVDPGPGRPKLWNRAEIEEWAINTGRMYRRKKWHRDPHYQDILGGLEDRLDPDLFEDCVADILHPEIPVVPIKGGNDAGMDGAVFDGRGEPYPLITTTTESVTTNLGDSLKSYEKEGGGRRMAVLATSRRLTALRRRNLHKKAAELGYTLVQIIDQRGVADRLYRSPRWCRLLLGLTGEPLPFRPFAPPTRQQHHRELIGRTEQTDFLRFGEGDQLLVGPPGSGKTAILSIFAEDTGALFLHPADLAAVTNGLRTQQPMIAIVDDAHTHMDALQLLVRLRTDLDLSYRIVSSVWHDPATETAIADMLDLGSSDRADIPLLTRDEIVEVVRQVGVEGPTDLVREIVNQARGLPGLAVTLARACLNGGVRDVASGDAIGREIRRVLDAQGLPNANDILAALGIAGEMGMRLEDAAEGLGLSLPEARREMAELSTAGVLGQADNARWAVYPAALRHVLVRDVFFGTAPGLSPEPFIERVSGTRPIDSDGTDGDLQWLLKSFPKSLLENRPHKEIARTLIGVTRAGGQVPPRLITEHLQRSESNEAWAELAWLGADEARHALRERPAALLEYPKPFLHWIPCEALTGLLDAASSDQKPLRHTLKAPPLQVVTKWIKSTWQPEETLRRRELATKTAIRWGGAHPASDLPCRVIEAVLTPGFEYSTLDPGSGDTLTINSGVLHGSVLQEVLSLWSDPLLPFLKTRPPGTLRPVIRAVSSWKNLSHATFASPSPEEASATQRMAIPMIADLLNLTSDHPGLWAEVARLAEEVGMETDSPDWEYTLMYGPLDGSDAADWEAAEADRAEKAQNLGISRADSNPAAVATRLGVLETAASEAADSWPRYTPQYVEALALHSSRDPLEWVREFVAASLSRDLVRPFLSRALENGSPGAWDTARDLMEHPEYEWLVIETTITSCHAPPDLEDKAISRLSPHIRALEWTVQRDNINPGIMRRLLQHENDKVASAVATGIWSKEQSPPSDSEIGPPWRQAVVQTRENLGRGYRLGRILAADQELAVEWLAEHFKANPTIHLMEKSPTQIAIDSLDERRRIGLLLHLEPEFLPHQVTARIVGNSPLVYRALLQNDDLKGLHLTPLEGQLDKEEMGLDQDWMARVEMALDSGYTSEQIAKAVIPIAYTWSGTESQMWESWIAAFKAIPSDTPDIQAIQNKGIAFAEERRGDALSREHAQRVYGRTYAG